MEGGTVRNALFAILAVALIAFVPVACADADADDSQSAETDTSSTDAGSSTISPGNIGDATVLSAHGIAGTADDAAEWTYARSEDESALTIGTGSVALLSEWVIIGLTIDSEEIIGSALGQYGPEDILKDTVDLTVDGEVTASSGAMRSVTPVSVKMGSGCTSIAAGTFVNCSSLTSVDVGDVVSIGSRAFEGCSVLREVDVKKATVDQTAFKNCARLTSFKATGSSVYVAEDGILYTIDRSTLYLCPTAKTGQMGISDIDANTTVINLGYADVFYALDMKGVDRTISFVNGVDAREVRARGLVYSSLGMNSCSVSELPSNQGGFRMTYSLFNGWSVVLDEGSYSGATATLAGNAITLTLESGNLSAVAYPMGVATITCGDLAKMTEMNGWAVTLTGLPAGDGVVEDIGSIGVSVTGYLGSDTDAELSRDMRYRGIGFEVTSVALTASTAGNLQNLTVGDGIPIGKDSFTALSGLRSVKADYVSEVGDGAFRFCTSLKEVSFASCSRFGAYAFESCWSLESVNLGSGDISFGEDALRGCRALKILTVGMDTSIEGADDVIVLHYDTSDSNVKAFEVHGDFVLVTWWYGRTIEYSGTDDRTAAESMDFYYGSPNPTTVIPASDEMYVWVSTGPLNTSGRILVVFDYGLGVGYDTQRILTGTAASDPGARAHLGYHFQYWTLDGTNPFDFGTRLVQSTVLTAVWSKDDPVDPTPLYLGAILVASVIATFAVLAVGRRKH